jgi:hypothetical protein
MSLSIQDLGAIGELIGAVAVVVTLIYLASQIRQNTLAVKASTMQSLATATSEVWRNACMDYTRTEKFFEIAHKTDKSEAERQFHLGWIMQTIRAQENMFFNLKIGTVDDEFVQLESRLIALFGSEKSVYRQAWDRGEINNFLADDFLEYLSSIIEKHPLLLAKSA